LANYEAANRGLYFLRANLDSREPLLKHFMSKENGMASFAG
jgi:hypothetical protein